MTPALLGPQPQDCKDHKDPGMHDLVEVGYMEPTRFFSHFFNDPLGHPAYEQDHNRPADGGTHAEAHHRSISQPGRLGRIHRVCCLRRGVHRVLSPRGECHSRENPSYRVPAVWEEGALSIHGFDPAGWRLFSAPSSANPTSSFQRALMRGRSSPIVDAIQPKRVDDQPLACLFPSEVFAV